MSKEIENGAVVQLKSGGPEMTANNVTGYNAECVWFVEGEVRRATFQATSLQCVDADADADLGVSNV